MGSRVHFALIVAVAAALARGLVAQNPPPAAPQSPAARDTTARDTSGVARLIYSDVVAGRSALAPRIALTEGVVYRIEVDPASAALSIRSARHPRLPPLFMVPLPDAAFGTATDYLVVPPSTEEYLIDLAATTDVVRLRIWLDPKESARWNRIRTEGFRLPILAIGLRAVYLAPFRDAHSSPLDSLYGYATAPQSAVGLKTCLAVVPTGRILPDRVGGCALALTLWHRALGRNFYTLGIEPEVVVSRALGSEVSLSPQLAFGNTTGGAPRASYVFLGLGARYARELTHKPALGFQAEATLLDVRSLPASANPARVSAIALSLGAGLALAL